MDGEIVLWVRFDPFSTSSRNDRSLRTAAVPVESRSRIFMGQACATIGRAAERPSVARCLGQLMLGNNDVARCDFVWRQPRLKCHLPGRLPDNANYFPPFGSDVVELIPKSRWLISDRVDSVLLATHRDSPSGPPR